MMGACTVASSPGTTRAFMSPSPANLSDTVACPHCHTLNRVRHGDPRQAHCGRCSGVLFVGRPVPLDRTSFERHVKTGLPLLVDFWAPWCGPCLAMAPSFEQAAAELEPQLRLGKVNTDEQPELANRFGIRSIPTLVLFRQGREQARVSGALSLGQLLEWVRSAL
jgi:thioredoxin 2